MAELLSSVKNSKWQLSAILNYCFAMLDHPRSLTVDRKPVFKFHLDQFGSFEDIVNRNFSKFGLKRIFGPPKFTFFWGGGYIIFHHRDPQKALSWRKTRPISRHAS